MTDETTPPGPEDSGVPASPDEQGGPKWSWGAAADPTEPKKKRAALKWPWAKKDAPDEPQEPDDSYWSAPEQAAEEPATPAADAQTEYPAETPFAGSVQAPEPWVETTSPEYPVPPGEPAAPTPATPEWLTPAPVSYEPATPSEPEQPVYEPAKPFEPEPPVVEPEHSWAPETPVAAAAFAASEIAAPAESAPVAETPVFATPGAVAAGESEATAEQTTVFGSEAVMSAEPASVPQPAPAPEPAPIAQPTTLIQPVAPAPAMMPQPVPVMPPPAAPSLGPTIPSGSRVVVMVSRGPSPMPPASFVTVPQVVGMAQGDALARLQESGLPSQVFNDYNERLPRGQVIGQLPEPGVTVPAGAESVLMVSSGPAAAPTMAASLPNVIGLAESDAVSRLQAAGLSPQLVREYSPNLPDGVVIAQLPNSASLIEMPKRRSLAWLWIVLALLVVAALGVGAYLYLNRTGVVPSVVGLTQAEATTALESAGFKLGSVTATQTLKASEVGKVVAQSPTANTEAKMTAGIGIVVSGGQKLMPVPIVVGKTQSEAEKALKDSGFKVTVSQGFSSTVAKGLVISQAPESGQKVPAETSVGIVVSEGAQNITVPGLSGQTLNQATTTLKSLGLGVEDVTNFSSTTKGQVEDQFPAAGSSVPPSTIVALIISGGSTTATGTVTVPNLKAMTATSAETAIKNLGLKWVSVQWSGTGLPLNEVYGQIPDSGALVPKNSSVIAIVSNGK